MSGRLYRDWKTDNGAWYCNQKINALESYNRRENLLITGLPTAHAAEAVSAETPDRGEYMKATERVVLALCNTQLGVPITRRHQHHAPAAEETRHIWSAAVMVRFTNRKAREAVYAAHYQLKSCSPPVYINENLTKTTAALFSHARKLVKSMQIFKTWTSGGSVYYRLNSEPSCRPVLVTSVADLPTNFWFLCCPRHQLVITSRCLFPSIFRRFFHHCSVIIVFINSICFVFFTCFAFLMWIVLFIAIAHSVNICLCTLV